MGSDFQNTFQQIANKLLARFNEIDQDRQDVNLSLPQFCLNNRLVQADDQVAFTAGNPDQLDDYRQRIDTDQGPIWVSKNAIMCACPNCQAPVSVRLLLMVAECWNCNISIVLSEQQLRAIEALLETTSHQISEVVTPPKSNKGVRTRRTQIGDRLPLHVGDEFRPERSVRLLRRAMNSLPAWLISFLVNLIMLLILALIFIVPDDFSPAITLSTFVSSHDQEGSEPELRSPEDPLKFDSALPQLLEIGEEEWRAETKRAEIDAAELWQDAVDADVEQLKERVTQLAGPETPFLLRDPRLRNEILYQNGGTTLTEAAVARGLRWLAQVQNVDGSWSLANYRRHKDPRNEGDAAATSLALLPFLGAGQTHESGKYRDTVMRGIKWLIDRQKANGDLRCDFPGEAGMYVHGQATIVIIEALAMTGDEKLRVACERATKFIENAQHKDGGWRYQPLQAGDTSVFGWQLMALQSARNSGAGIPVDRSTMRLAGYYLDQAGKAYASASYSKYLDGAVYRYAPNLNDPTPAMTAEALLCRFYLGWDRDDPRIVQGIRYL
ncbi:MAG TPA: terpene cyclase/mutase family protein, partial [Pirellulaceae bacterium]|nr:terpene cyclase/mutase family protein [Pirellulaceae bacterium]